MIDYIGGWEFKGISIAYNVDDPFEMTDWLSLYENRFWFHSLIMFIKTFYHITGLQSLSPKNFFRNDSAACIGMEDWSFKK